MTHLEGDPLAIFKIKSVCTLLFALLVSVSMAEGQYLQASSSITQCPGMAPEVVRIDITDAA